PVSVGDRRRQRRHRRRNGTEWLQLWTASPLTAGFVKQRCRELVSKWPGEDEDHAEVEEGEVVVGFAVAAGGDAAFGFQPGVGTFEGPALTGERVWGFRLALAAAPDLAPGRAGWGWVAGGAAFADPGFD